MICSSNCKICSSKESHGISLGTPSVPVSVNANEMFPISFTVTNSSVTADGLIYACLTDTEHGTCIYSSSLTVVPAYGGQITFGPWQIKMPSSDYHLNLSIIEDIGILGMVCDDFLEFTIQVIAPQGQGYLCNQHTKICEASTSSVQTWDQCNKECGTGTGTKPVSCTENDMNIMGICVPKPVALGVGILAALIIYKKLS